MIREVGGHKPKIHPTVFIHESAEVIGKVTLGKNVSVWPFCSLRGDVDRIVIGEGTNIQDNTVIHTLKGHPTIIGKGNSVAHSVVLHGCKVMDHCIIGIGAVVLDGAVVEEGSIVGAGAVVSPNMRIPKGSLAMGVPARVVRRLRPDEIKRIKRNAKGYFKYVKVHRKTSRIVF